MWSILPGARATEFRTKIIDTCVRVFGGDETIVDEVRDNRQSYENLAENNPGRAFGDEIPTGTALAHRNTFEDDMRRTLAELGNQIRTLNARDERNEQFRVITEELRAERRARVELQVELNALRNTTTIEINGVKSMTHVRTNAIGFAERMTVDAFRVAPGNTAVRFVDLFHMIGILFVPSDMFARCGANARLRRPVANHRNQIGRDGRIFRNVAHTRASVDTMLYGMLTTCGETGHRFPVNQNSDLTCLCPLIRDLASSLDVAL